jgi:hypothetical protein
VRQPSAPGETLIYYQKRSDYIGGTKLRCSILVHDKIYETELMSLHGVTFTPQSACSVETTAARGLAPRMLASSDVLGYKASGPAAIQRDL